MAPRAALVFIKLIHTFIWFVMVAAIAYVVWSGISDNVSAYSWIAAGLVLEEGFILLFFRGSCPLTVLARKYSNSDQPNFDIFLPRWLARYNKQLFTSIFLFGLILVVYRCLG